MNTVILVGSWAAAITAVIIMAKHLWFLFVSGVKTAISEEMSRFHRDLSSYDEFWTERLDRLEKTVQILEQRSKQLFDMVAPGGQNV
jgi:hypothetical protein